MGNSENVLFYFSSLCVKNTRAWDLWFLRHFLIDFNILMIIIFT